MIIQKNGLTIPEYLDKDFFRKVLKGAFQTNEFMIEKINFTMGSGGGENYCSFIYRAVIDAIINGTIRHLTVIIKSMPTDGERQVFEEIQLHRKETDMYFNILPKMEELLNTKLSPK